GTAPGHSPAAWASCQASGSRCSPAITNSAPAAAPNHISCRPGRHRARAAPATVATPTTPTPAATNGDIPAGIACPFAVDVLHTDGDISTTNHQYGAGVSSLNCVLPATPVPP